MSKIKFKKKFNIRIGIEIMYKKISGLAQSHAYTNCITGWVVYWIYSMKLHDS